jgi:hypothetical protein
LTDRAIADVQEAAMIFECIYFLGFVAAPFVPETKGQPLPENV